MSRVVTDQMAAEAAMPTAPSGDVGPSVQPGPAQTGPAQRTDTLHDVSDPSLPPVIVGDALLADPGYATFDVFDGGEAAVAVIASCPHAGRGYPAGMLAAASQPVEALRGLEDFGVDCLLPGLASCGITTVVNRLARAYLDVNRDATALDTSMFDGALTAAPPCHHVRAGYGLIPRLTSARKPIYGDRLDAAEASRRIAISHTPYHTALATLTEAAMTRHDSVLLVDFHSMPGYDRLNNALPDIILGDGYGATLDRKMAEAVTGFFRKQGLSVTWNHPYSGGHITRNYGDARTARQAFQVEINRGLYMSGTDRLDDQRASALRDTITSFGAFLCAAMPAAS